MCIDDFIQNLISRSDLFMKKFLCSALLVALMVSLASCTWAEYYNEGNDGSSEEKAYIIDSVDDLLTLRNRVNFLLEPAGKYYKLDFQEKSVDLTGYKDWTLIGNVFRTNAFKGHFDGNDHTVIMNVSSEKAMISLFGFVETTTGYAIKNLNVQGTLSGSNVAGIAFELHNGLIENCSFTGSLHALGDGRSGSIVTYLFRGKIINCTVSSTDITGPDNTNVSSTIGGLVGYSYQGTIESCTVTNTTVSAYSELADSLRSNIESNAGGIVGYSAESAIKKCTFQGSVSNSNNSGGIAGYGSRTIFDNNQVLEGSKIYGAQLSGGISGLGNLGDSNFTNNKVISSDIKSEAGSAGGIAGSTNGSIENCEVTDGTIVTANGAELGGIAGNLSGSVKNNTSYASIQGSAQYKGGIAGWYGGSTSENNRYAGDNGADHGFGYHDGFATDNPGCIPIGRASNPDIDLRKKTEEKTEEEKSSGGGGGGCDSGLGILGVVCLATSIVFTKRK